MIRRVCCAQSRVGPGAQLAAAAHFHILVSHFSLSCCSLLANSVFQQVEIWEEEGILILVLVYIPLGSGHSNCTSNQVYKTQPERQAVTWESEAGCLKNGDYSNFSNLYKTTTKQMIRKVLLFFKARHFCVQSLPQAPTAKHYLQ